jgi:cob(I)alamin adenosyltransferase
VVRITRVYTRTGDAGTTRLGDMSEVAKTDLRIAAYGDVDELNSVIGVARATRLSAESEGALSRIQNELFDVGADLAVPGAADDRLRVTDAQVEALERDCDAFNEPLPALESFVLPAGGATASALHHARTVCRRAERSVVALADTRQGQVNPVVIRYLNRLSDMLFVMARAANHDSGAGDVLWEPGETREGTRDE